MLSRKASATAELPADIHMMSREMQTPVGVLKRIVVHDGSMTNTVMYRRVEACAMLSRRESATVEHPANFCMTSREMQTVVGTLGMVDHQDQSGMETENLGVGMMIEEQKIGTDSGVTTHLRDHEVRGRGTMTDPTEEEKQNQKDADMMWNMRIASGQGTAESDAMKEVFTKNTNGAGGRGGLTFVLLTCNTTSAVKF